MNILFANRQDALPVSKLSVNDLTRLFLEWKNVSCHEVSIQFVEKKEICELHEKFFNDSTPTDCISFPIDPPGKDCAVLGEIFVCPEIGIEYAKKIGEDPYLEVSLYVVHGLLHLLGFNDIKDEERMVMRGEENSAIEYLKKNKGLLYA